MQSDPFHTPVGKLIWGVRRNLEAPLQSQERLSNQVFC